MKNVMRSVTIVLSFADGDCDINSQIAVVGEKLCDVCVKDKAVTAGNG